MSAAGIAKDIVTGMPVIFIRPWTFILCERLSIKASVGLIWAPPSTPPIDSPCVIFNGEQVPIIVHVQDRCSITINGYRSGF